MIQLYKLLFTFNFMILLFIVGLLLGAVSVMFALQNVSVVTVTFFQWSFDGSLAVVLLLAITSGILICLLLVLPGSIGTTFKFRRMRKEYSRLEEELRKQKELTMFAHHDTPSRGDIEKIENGAVIVNNEDKK